MSCCCVIPADFPPPIPQTILHNRASWSAFSEVLGVPPPAQAAEAQVAPAWGAILASGQRRSWNKIWSPVYDFHIRSAQSVTPENSTYISILFVFILRNVLRVDLHCNKEISFLWQVLQLLRYSIESVALMKVTTVRKPDKQFAVPVELWQQLCLLPTSINSGNNFPQQVFVIKAVGGSKFVEISTSNLTADAFRCLLIKKL